MAENTSLIDFIVLASQDPVLMANFRKVQNVEELRELFKKSEIDVIPNYKECHQIIIALSDLTTFLDSKAPQDPDKY